MLLCYHKTSGPFFTVIFSTRMNFILFEIAKKSIKKSQAHMMILYFVPFYTSCGYQPESGSLNECLVYSLKSAFSSICRITRYCAFALNILYWFMYFKRVLGLFENSWQFVKKTILVIDSKSELQNNLWCLTVTEQ